jgi:hypothetical protein
MKLILLGEEPKRGKLNKSLKTIMHRNQQKKYYNIWCNIAINSMFRNKFISGKDHLMNSISLIISAVSEIVSYGSL